MYRWATLWTIANVTSLLGALLELFELGKEEAKLKKRLQGGSHLQDEDKGSAAQVSPQSLQKQQQQIKLKKFT